MRSFAGETCSHSEWGIPSKHGIGPIAEVQLINSDLMVLIGRLACASGRSPAQRKSASALILHFHKFGFQTHPPPPPPPPRAPSYRPGVATTKSSSISVQQLKFGAVSGMNHLERAWHGEQQAGPAPSFPCASLLAQIWCPT